MEKTSRLIDLISLDALLAYHKRANDKGYTPTEDDKNFAENKICPILDYSATPLERLLGETELEETESHGPKSTVLIFLTGLFRISYEICHRFDPGSLTSHQIDLYERTEP